MRVARGILRLLPLLGALLAAAVAGDQPAVPGLVCADGVPGAPACTVTSATRKEAKAAFQRGMKLQKEKKLDEALTEFEHAALLVPTDVQYSTIKELVRQQLVFDYLQRGNKELADGRQVEALADFRSALKLDPANDFANQRLRDSLGTAAPQVRQAPRIVEDQPELRVHPNPQPQSFHFRGDSKMLLTQVASAYGVTATIDETVPNRRVRFDVENVPFETAMDLACKVTKSFYSPLDAKQVYVALESVENRRQYEHMGLRSFYLPEVVGSQTEFNDVVNSLRTLFEIRFLSPSVASGVIQVRAPQNLIEAATQYLEGLDQSRPEVLLDVHVFQVSNRLTRDFGLHIPSQFTLYNIPAAALLALGGQDLQSLINQLIAGGGINQANSQAISGLLAQLQGQQNSIFSQPLATFGNGLTLFGVSLGTLSATLQQNESAVRSLEHVTMRASQGHDSSFHLGSRYPVINASFSPIYNTPAIAQVISNNSYINPVPSYSYEDLGVNLKVKPIIHGDADVSMSVEMQVRSLTGDSFNGVPVISNREYKGSITLKNGEQAMVAGEISNTEQRSLNGIPGLGDVPGLNKIASSNSMENDQDELLIVITPQISRESIGPPPTEIWLSQNP
jgi:tetratricopeptide (TPR) repeat protein